MIATIFNKFDRSLDKLSRGRRSSVQNISDPVIDLLSSLLEAERVVGLRSVKICAMTTPDTVTHTRSLVDLRSVSQLSNPLPRVLPTVGEEDVGSSNFVATIVILSSVDRGELRHIELREHHLAVG